MHRAFREGPQVEANELWTEIAAAARFGLDPETYFLKDRHLRMLITGYHVARAALDSMIAYDTKPKPES